MTSLQSHASHASTKGASVIALPARVSRRCTHSAISSILGCAIVSLMMVPVRAALPSQVISDPMTEAEDDLAAAEAEAAALGIHPQTGARPKAEADGDAAAKDAAEDGDDEAEDDAEDATVATASKAAKTDDAAALAAAARKRDGSDGARSGPERQKAKAADLGKEEEDDDDDKVDDTGSVTSSMCDATRFHTDTESESEPENFGDADDDEEARPPPKLHSDSDCESGAETDKETAEADPLTMQLREWSGTASEMVHALERNIGDLGRQKSELDDLLALCSELTKEGMPLAREEIIEWYCASILACSFPTARAAGQAQEGRARGGDRRGRRRGRRG